MPKEIKKHETHATCNKRLQQKGGKAECCWCVPHSHCEFMKPKSLKSKIIEILKSVNFTSSETQFTDKYYSLYADQILSLLEGEKQTCPYCGQYPHLDKCAFSGKPEAGDKDIFKENWEKEWNKRFFSCIEIGAIEHSDEMIPFIRNLLISEKQKWVEEIDKVYKKERGTNNWLDLKSKLLKRIK